MQAILILTISISVIYSCIIFLIYVLTELSYKILCNPRSLYNEWKQINWFGIILFSLFFNILFLPCTLIVIPFTKLIKFIFTTGRK